MVAFLSYQTVLFLAIHCYRSATADSALREISRHLLLTHQKAASKFLILNQAGSAHGVKNPVLETASNILLKPEARHCSAR